MSINEIGSMRKMFLPLLLVLLPLNAAIKVGLRSVETTLTDEDRELIKTELNNFRAGRGSSNMHCLTEWSTELEESAANATAECTSEPYKIQQGTAAIYVANENNDLKEIIAELAQMAAKYNYAYNKCTQDDDSPCENYKQFVWWEGGKFGCKMTTCKTPPSYVATLLTCAFEKAINPDAGQPFATGTQNYLCKQAMLRWTHPFSRRKFLRRKAKLVHTTRNDTMLTTSEERRIELIGKSYADKGIFGYIAKDMDATACPYLKPLIALKRKAAELYVYVAAEEFKIEYEANSYEVANVLGYVVPSEGQCAASLKAYQFRRSTLNQYYYTVDSVDAAEILEKKGTFVVYSLVHTPFVLWHQP
ncbi:hypothetical protein M513_04729 [Trichuris suis]|uniref:SCP domain-containing protein n=1 Tax=Trichuris suis TaxID=68888 RepID=A0A085MAZ0_9BILA|nr:hypothetical protein M513_04729 [Trichuris suis]